MRDEINGKISDLNTAVHFNDNASDKAKIIKEILLFLRNACVHGAEYQNLIISKSQLRSFILNQLFPVNVSERHCLLEDERVNNLTWQLVANICVQNPLSQEIVWDNFGNLLVESFESQPLNKFTDIKLMILYNIFKLNKKLIDDITALKAIIKVWSRASAEEIGINFEYLHLFFEIFLVQSSRSTVKAYSQLESHDKISLLDYIIVYVRNDNPNGPINTFLLQFISKEFKIKSDCILRRSVDDIEGMQPKQVYALLSVIASASGCDIYSDVYRSDNALFLNVSSVLRCLIDTGKESENVFTPMNKLEHVAPASKHTMKLESEISFELKTLLVRAVANLLHKNEVNQRYCADTKLLHALFECTNMDARNPLVKEWSILAIRNACIGCAENQNIISEMTQKGVATNEIVKELNLEMGSLRINPKI